MFSDCCKVRKRRRSGTCGSPSEVTKNIWAHIKKNKLQNPKNKREILADEKLQPIFGGKKLEMFQMTKAVNKHLK